MQRLNATIRGVIRLFHDNPPKEIAMTLCLLLLAVTAGVYWKVSTHEFLNYDDQAFVYENPHVYTGLNAPNVKWAFTTLNGGASYYHPLTWLSHQLDCQLFGLRPGAHHLTNLCFHLANCVLVLVVLHSLTGAVWRSFLVAALFALHPLHIETVAWISERKSLICTLFWLLTLWAYGCYVRAPGLRSYLTVLAVFLCSLISKPFAVSLPFVLLLLDYWPLRRFEVPAALSPERVCDHRTSRIMLTVAVLEKVPLFGISAFFSWLTIKAQQDLGAMPSLEMLPLDVRLENAVVSYLLYIRKMVLPFDLAAIYPIQAGWDWWQILGSSLFLLTISILAVRSAARAPYLLTGWLWYIGTLFPVIGIVQAGGQGMADRYTYVPLVGLFIILAWGGRQVTAQTSRSRAAFAFTGTAAVSLFALLTMMQVGYWKNNLRLFQHATVVTESNYIAYHNLGLALHELHNLAEAEQAFRESLKISSEHACHRSLGDALLEDGNFEDAFFHYSIALQLAPTDPETYASLANFHVKCTEPKYRSPAKAVYYAQRACILTHYRRRDLLVHWARICADDSKYSKAEFAAQLALNASVSPQDISASQRLINAIRSLEAKR
jgi:tetratricopeptide (TPR) repeat protein